MSSLRSFLSTPSICLSVFLGFAAPLAFSQELRTTEHQVLSEADLITPPWAYGGFGASIAIEGDTLIIGSSFGGPNGIWSGLAYVYTYRAGGWTLEASLVPEDARSGQRFGYEVDIQGDRAFIGSPDDDEFFAKAGAVYVFERTGSTWQQVQKIYDNDPGAQRWFGTTVAVDGNHLLISGANASDDSYWTNELHSFERMATGSFVFREAFDYSGPLPNMIGSFGNPLTADGNAAASYYYGGGIQFFERSGPTWNAGQTLQPTSFVEDLVLVEDLCVSSYLSPSGTPNVDVYRRTGGLWALEAQLVASRNSIDRRYGYSVATDGDVIAVGTGLTFWPNVAPGEVTVFQSVDGEWVESVVLQGDHGDSHEYLGKELALAEGQVVTTAALAVPRGRVLTFDLDEQPQSYCLGTQPLSSSCGACPCGNNAIAPARGGCLNATFRSAVLSVSGSPSVTNDTLRFGLSRANISTFAILVSGANQAPNNSVNPCSGMGTGITSSLLSGLRCVVGDIRRHGTRATDSQGSVGETTAAWGSSGGLLAEAGVVAGQTRHYQAYYREELTAACPLDQNTSQGISIVVRP